LSLWYDNRSESKDGKERYYKINTPSFDNKKFKVNNEGIFKEEISDPQLWISLNKLVEEHGIGSIKERLKSLVGKDVSEYARIMFSVSQIDSLCDNNIAYPSDHVLLGQIYPIENQIKDSTASIPNTTEYKGLFLDATKKPLTDIISYTDAAHISLQRINSPKDTEVKNLEIRLIENRPNTDLMVQTETIDAFDKEGCFIRPVSMRSLFLTSSGQPTY